WLWLAYTICCALGIWSHFVTAFVPIGHGVWLTWRAVRWREWRFSISGISSLILAASITITLYAPVLPSMLAARGMFTATDPNQPTILGSEGLHALLQLGGSWYWWAAIPGLIALLIGLTVSVVLPTPVVRASRPHNSLTAITGCHTAGCHTAS